MKRKIQQLLRKIVNVFFRIQSVLFFVLGTVFLLNLHWDTYWTGLIFILSGWSSWHLDKLWFLLFSNTKEQK